MGTTISKSLNKLLKTTDGVWGVYVKRMGSKKVIFQYNQNRIFPAASLGKIPIALFAFSQVERGKNSFKETVPLVEKYKLGGSGVLEYLDSGLKLTLLDVVKLMLLVSDNTAAKLLVKRFTPQKINCYLNHLGLKVTKLKIDGNKFGYGLTTPREIAGLLEGIYRGKYFNQELSNTLLDILKKSHNDLGIRRYLPHDQYNEEVKLEVASKSGSIPGVRGEVALVFGKAPYVISILSKNLTDKAYKPDNEGWLAIAKFSKKVYKILDPPTFNNTPSSAT